MLRDRWPAVVHMTDPIRLRIDQRLAELGSAGGTELSAEHTLRLLGNQFRCPSAYRLPPLALIAALRCLADQTRARIADEQTGAAGDVEITLVSEERVRTVYEMKQKAVTIDDLDRAVEKAAGLPHRIDNYIFVGSEPADPAVQEHATELYDSTGGTEFAILDCLGFLRHFLHLFHRSRMAFLDAYQQLVLAEPDSAVSLPLKEVFLSLRQQAEAES